MHESLVTRRVRVVWVALTLCVALAAGCGGDDNDEAGSDTPVITEFKGDPNQACTLATKAEVEAAIATKVREGVGDAGKICTYTLETAFDQYVVIERNESPQSQQIFDLRKTSEANVEPLAGVGNDAFISGNKAFVLKGAVMATITVSVKQPPATVGAAVRRLAQTAGTRA